MDARIDKIEQEIAALEAQHKALSLKKELSDSEKYDLAQIPLKLARLDDYRKTLVTFLANTPAPTQAQGSLLIELLILDMDVDMPSFQPSKYSLEFPFFETKDIDNHIDILGRDDLIKKVNSIMHNRLNKDKYWPVIISTSRGMGKTFFLKKYGMQQIKDHLKTDIVGHAITTGRILSFDFVKHPNAIQNENDVYSFFPRLMVFFLCRIFSGKQVDGINFDRIMSFDKVATASGQQLKFKRWLLKWQTSNAVEEMIDEYIRLTNIAFGTTHNSPPVFLLDEIQILRDLTNVKSSFLRDGTPQNHSLLSLLLTQLAGKLKPICICTGTNNGKIISITREEISEKKSSSLCLFRR
jgi:Cdc6-like AAA superfamily ATPase